jgi:hypothetical protein
MTSHVRWDLVECEEQSNRTRGKGARAAMLTIARLDPQGRLTPVATVAGARNAVATDEGAAYLIDSSGGKILSVTPVTSR